MEVLFLHIALSKEGTLSAFSVLTHFGVGISDTVGRPNTLHLKSGNIKDAT